MDLITSIPKLGSKSVIMVVVDKLSKYAHFCKSVIVVVVDRLSKYAHFCALPHPFTPTLVAQSFMD